MSALRVALLTTLCALAIAQAQQPPPNPFLQPLPPPPPLEAVPPELGPPSPVPEPPTPQTFVPYPSVPISITPPLDTPQPIPLPPETPALTGLLPHAHAPTSASSMRHTEALSEQDTTAALDAPPDGPSATLPSRPTPRTEPAAPRLIAIITADRPLAVIEYAARRYRLHLHDTLPDDHELVRIGSDYIELQRGERVTRITFP